MRKMILKAQLLLLDENDDFRHQNALLVGEQALRVDTTDASIAVRKGPG